MESTKYIYHVFRLPDVLGQIFVDGFPDDAEETGESGATDPPFLFRILIVTVTHLRKKTSTS
jgi:hypothetical protein